ncbi:MAG: PEP-CTERM sorting domain-containing protein [Nitrospiraceae bacterium]|nr:MAG: PEP-CTERM sorting domain-containing protein [Nitrospiraceae bacterium]
MKQMYKKVKIMLLSFVAVLFCLSINAHAGKIVLANDEWTLSNSGFFSPNDPGVFATNVGSWFTGGSTGNFLAYSSNFGLTQSSLANAMTSAGNAWTVSTAVPFTLATLQSYDAVFLSGNSASNSVLIDYVNAGGNVYLAGGTGWGGSVAEANQWKAFLNNFGLGFGTYYNGIAGSIAIDNSHPIFAGVDHLYQNNGNDALDILALDPQSTVLVSYNGHGLYAVYESYTPPTVPEPSTFVLLAAGLAGAGFFVRRRKK